MPIKFSLEKKISILQPSSTTLYKQQAKGKKYISSVKLTTTQ